jgi:hypothetical protein
MLVLLMGGIWKEHRSDDFTCHDIYNKFIKVGTELK